MPDDDGAPPSACLHAFLVRDEDGRRICEQCGDEYPETAPLAPIAGGHISQGKEVDAHALHDSLQQRGSRAGADVTGPATTTVPTGVVAGPPMLCKCGHDLDAHTGSGVVGISCKVCGVTDRGLPTGNCMGWEPMGAVAGPPDLTHAIQAATEALREEPNPYYSPTRYQRDARIAVEAAAPVLLQATRDRLADLEVYTVEQHDFIRSVEWYGTRCNQDITGCEEEEVCPVCDASENEGHRPDCRLAHALQVDPPTRGRAILGEVERLREAIRENLSHVPYRVEQDLRAALDLGAAQEEDSGG